MQSSAIILFFETRFPIVTIRTTRYQIVDIFHFVRKQFNRQNVVNDVAFSNYATNLSVLAHVIITFEHYLTEPLPLPSVIELILHSLSFIAIACYMVVFPA